jgi:regulatory protein
VRDEERHALDVAGRALGRRDLSSAALRSKLVAAGVSRTLADEAVERLVQDGLVDDARAASSLARSLAGRGYGDRAIDARLERDGFDRACRDAALGELEAEDVRALAIARGAGSADLRRVAVGLQRRGFGADAIESVLASADASGRPKLR